MLHYFAQSFFAAVFPVAFEEDDTLLIYAISDLSRDLKLRAVVGFRSQNNLKIKVLAAVMLHGKMRVTLSFY